MKIKIISIVVIVIIMVSFFAVRYYSIEEESIRRGCENLMEHSFFRNMDYLKSDELKKDYPYVNASKLDSRWDMMERLYIEWTRAYAQRLAELDEDVTQKVFMEFSYQFYKERNQYPELGFEEVIPTRLGWIRLSHLDKGLEVSSMYPKEFISIFMNEELFNDSFYHGVAWGDRIGLLGHIIVDKEAFFKHKRELLEQKLSRLDHFDADVFYKKQALLGLQFMSEKGIITKKKFYLTTDEKHPYYDTPLLISLFEYYTIIRQCPDLEDRAFTDVIKKLVKVMVKDNSTDSDFLQKCLKLNSNFKITKLYTSYTHSTREVNSFRVPECYEAMDDKVYADLVDGFMKWYHTETLP